MVDHAHRRDVTLLIIFVAFCIATFVVLFKAGGGHVSDGDAYRVEAVLPTAVALAPSADVRMSGVRIGRVAKVGSRAGNAVVQLNIDRDHAPLYRNARVQIRAKSLIGENYLEVDRGTSNAGQLPDDGVLPLKNADDVTQLDEVLSTFDAPTRRDLRRTLNALGGGLAGRGTDLNRTFANLSHTVDAGTDVAVVLDGQREHLAALVDDLGQVTQALGDRRLAIQTLARRGKVAASVVARRQRDLSALLRVLPGALAETRATTAALGRFSDRATPTVSDLAAAIETITPAVDRVPAAATATREVVARLGDWSANGRKLLSSVRRFSVVLKPSLPQIDELLRQALPSLDYLRPYARDIAAFFSNTSGMTGGYDATGHVARAAATYGASTLPLMTAEARRGLAALEKAGGITRLLQSGNNNYPEPGTSGKYTQFNGEFKRIQPLSPIP